MSFHHHFTSQCAGIGINRGYQTVGIRSNKTIKMCIFKQRWLKNTEKQHFKGKQFIWMCYKGKCFNTIFNLKNNETQMIVWVFRWDTGKKKIPVCISNVWLYFTLFVSFVQSCWNISIALAFSVRGKCRSSRFRAHPRPQIHIPVQTDPFRPSCDRPTRWTSTSLQLHFRLSFILCRLPRLTRTVRTERRNRETPSSNGRTACIHPPP